MLSSFKVLLQKRQEEVIIERKVTPSFSGVLYRSKTIKQHSSFSVLNPIRSIKMPRIEHKNLSEIQPKEKGRI